MTVPVETSVIPRGTYTGTPLCRPRGSQRFYQCPICGGWVDGTDMRQVIEHEGGAAPASEAIAAVAEAS
jgi:hypothetical protein